jgi:6,7-dimethyl-8-ribityllumazine synthase
MPNLLSSATDQTNVRIGIVVSRWNESITSRLLDGAIETLTRRDVPDQAIDVAYVPGAWEIPVVAQRMANSGRYHAVICLGAVIRGETTHDQHINRAVTLSMADIAVRHDLPVLLGLLTCETLEQAIQRSGGNVGNKGAECADAALEMIGLLHNI